jgi:predicted RND superfamily exporter protein
VVLLALHFRSLVPTLIALVPKVVGAIGMFFAMALGGVELNPANCMALPLTLGIGLVFGIHAVHRCLEAPGALLVRGGTGKAIALSALTTIASFGTLMAASHPGIFSLGYVMATGVAANMLATFLLVPPLVVLFKNWLG